MKILTVLFLILAAGCEPPSYSTESSGLTSSPPVIEGFTQPIVSTTVTSPSETQVGDWVITAVWSQGTTIPVHTLQAGYTLIASRQIDDGKFDGRLSLAYRIAAVDGAEAQTPFVITGATAGQTTMNTVAMSGVEFRGFANAYSTSSGPPWPAQYGQGTMYGDWIVITYGAWHITTSTATVASADLDWTLLTQNAAASHRTHLALESHEFLGLSFNSVLPPPFIDNATPNGTVAITLAMRGAYCGSCNPPPDAGPIGPFIDAAIDAP